MNGVNTVELGIVVAVFAFVIALGVVASRWRRAADPEHLDEWGLGGRRFGHWVTWFLIGGDLYTAYTFVAIPALVFSVGAGGFFALPYMVIVYPAVFLIVPRLWSVAHRHGYVTSADFVRGRTGSAGLALAVAVAGILATMPFIALQLVGIEAVLKTIGIQGEWPIVIAFALLAACTYRSGLRAPVLIAVVKDVLIYCVVIVGVLYIPYKLGGIGAVFDAADAKFAASPAPTDGLLLADTQTVGYSSLALGSALALFLYPHSVTAVLSSGSRDTVERSMAALPAYSFMLGLLALLGFMAIAAGVSPIGGDPNTVVPVLYERMFPDWFAGIALAAIGVGVLVPAAIMSIGAANLFTRNIYVEFLAPGATPRQQARSSRIASLVVKAGAVIVILMLDPQFSVDLQLIGGVVILMSLPSIVFSLFTRWFHARALLAGLLVGLASGLYMLYDTPNPRTGRAHFGGAQYALSNLGIETRLTLYTGILALIVNVAVAVAGTSLMRVLRREDRGADATEPADYHVESDAVPALAPALMVDAHRQV